MISIIIPAYNEEENIKYVINICKINKNVDEVIVVNNLSTDKTKEVSESEGAKVIDCEMKGKGYALERGLQECKNEIVVFLDGDINNYEEDIIQHLTQPIVSGQADFVKSTFNRKSGGVVTEIMTKPLLETYFPELCIFNEPLSGMIAGKKSMLKNLELEKDYGVDIGILIDMYKRHAKIIQVNIGEIENSSHKNKTVEKMRRMSTEVMRAILKRGNI